MPSFCNLVAQETTLLPGSVILTGTPHGIGFVRKPPSYLRNGDQLSVEIENIGSLYNHVIER
jgi:2-keto-4-pentenoate hydratase/2-oxohepta-3-ene-1,7-dioic acid hydratase in catechol pathway